MPVVYWFNPACVVLSEGSQGEPGNGEVAQFTLWAVSVGGEASQRGNPLRLDIEEGSWGSEKLNYLRNGCSLPRTTAIDASHRVEPVSAVVVCAANVQANTVVFFFPAFSNAPGVKGGGEGFPVLCDAPRMGIPVSPPPLCRGTPAMHRMRRLPGELYVNGSILLMFFFLFFSFQNSCFEFFIFFFCNL